VSPNQQDDTVNHHPVPSQSTDCLCLCCALLCSEEEEECRAVTQFVFKDLKPDLFTELMTMLQGKTKHTPTHIDAHSPVSWAVLRTSIEVWSAHSASLCPSVCCVYLMCCLI
jgi:hypothetical protein